ncbi:hypothetical protein [Caballeronia sp. Lep1P3]|uniref:hypothetical protein n=1 Tax=Caballeronia sp. Lep1P3 TaxID=2878150 RepID=UPI001FD18349|nr:hypothetical protein [Caballeronia sp. Lep1P3]
MGSSSTFRGHASSAFNAKLHPLHAMLVSRSASHIASAFTASGRDQALAEGIGDVIAHCGHAGLGLYLAAVWHWLDERNYDEAADAVQHYIESGTIPALKTARKIMRSRDARV